MMGSLCPESCANLLNFSTTGQSMLDTLTKIDIGNTDTQNPTHFGVNNDSYGLLLPTSMPGFTTSSSKADVPSIPLGDPSFQNPLYGCMQDSSELQHTGLIDPLTPTRTFVKVYE
ncbi:hypothetical protein V6N13_029671 [Hibiscus sabdariffa]|uniref:Uncharacterized protein n=1 Tax=Hibiscus sabdariffa TaxID=183260 RepID=A0ABR2T9H0_9ROSI